MDSENTIWSLIGGKLNEELSEEELPRLEELIQDKQLLARMEVIHSGVKEMKQVRRFDKNSSWDQIVRHVRNTKRRIQTMTVVGIAAALILTFILGTVFDRFRFETELPVQYAEIDVTYGQTNHLVLFDGTEVWLNSGTTFRYPSRFNLDERNVYVEGEAFFNVTSNE
ncbi:MAG: FecR domain-containing protein, partial [Mangrovibacterium sp.]|nr:FecR domain-containing protein [Mangrovibacterium sp.]